MDSYPPAHPPVDPHRPPGGTRRSGNKTPRKVQWVDNDEGAESSTRALDEHGLNPEPFETLKDALEKHRSQPSINTSEVNNVLRTVPTTDSSSLDSPTLDRTTTHTVPGETYIDKDETAGLPGTNDLEAYSQKRASQVVQAHKLGFFKSHLGFGASSRKPIKKRSKQNKGLGRAKSGEETDPETDVDVEHVAESSSSAVRPRPGTGVLSALLSLYDHERPSMSGMSTPARSSFEMDDSRPTSLYETMTKDSRSSFPFESAISPTPSMAELKAPNHPWTKTLAGGFGEKRPASARNAGGVFGALIASTGNLSAAASPMSSTLAPEVKRPGYKLSRYSLETSIPRLESAVHKERGLRRPQSMHFPPSETLTTVVTTPSSSGTSPSASAIFPGGSKPPDLVLSTGGLDTPGRQKWTGVLKDLPKRGWSRIGTPTASTPGTPNTDTDEWLGEKERVWDRDERKEKERKRRRKKAEIYITRHVAEIIQRQEFICKLTRSMMMFGGPSHRLQAQIQATARVLDISLSCMYLPDIMLISFDDASTGTSNIKLIRQGGAFDISKLQAAYKLYWKVIHDDISVKDASVELDNLMRKPPLYNKWQLIFFGGMCSASICSVSFNGSFIDSLIAFPLGCLLIVIQLFAAKHELYSNVFEITVATLFSFISAALASTGHFCYSSVAASSVVLILPSDVSAAVGALAVGFVSNLYARFFNGNAFVVMITGILFQLPSGVANGGLFTFVSKQDSGQSSSDVYLSGFQTALQLVSVSVGLTVGLGISLVLVFPIQSRRRAGGVFSL
ncbi:hypothetical protein EW026_g5356 [Hermanssonia centrifuga]|uniref:Threonine/serine exporter-like N-terminal domain-containing protein n=1 Tax=Hermanssonia centrifuga TaxID=98765 RepID=A0A4S4KEE7_9APHY|nr:hypothetical protein EW026_g5356 [Hermanssonia centrifuga]